MKARRNAIASVATAACGIGAALLATPLILDHVGRDGYGVWTLAMALVIYLGIVEAGMAPAAQRFVALARGAGDHARAARVFWSTLGFYLLLGLAGLALLELLAPAIARLFDLTPELEDEAIGLLRIVGLALPLGLLVAALANVLQGFERFTAVALTAALGSLAYLGALLALIGADASLSGLGWAVIAQQTVLVLARAGLVLDILRTRPGLVSRGEARAMAAMSARLQVSVASLIVNGQSDRVVAGLVAPPATVGQVGIAAQVAEAGRLLAAAPLVPATNRFAALRGTGDERGLHEAFARAEVAWVTVVLGAVAVGTACAAQFVRGWLGEGYGEAEAFATMLVGAYGVNLLVGMRTAYLRATGRVGLESRAGVVLMGLNLGCTVPLAVAFGAAGVVAGTLVAYLAGTAWFVRRFAAAAPEAARLRARDVRRPLALAVPLALVGGAIATGLVALVPAGWGLLLAVGAAGAAWAAYLALALRVRPAPRTLLRALQRARGASTAQSP